MGLLRKGSAFSIVPHEAQARGFRWTNSVPRLWIWTVTLQLNSLWLIVLCLILGFGFAFAAWERPSAMAVLLRPDPGGCTKTPLLRGRHRVAAGGHGEWHVEVTSMAGRRLAPPL